MALRVLPRSAREEDPPKEGEPSNTGPEEAKTIAERFFPKDMERRLPMDQTFSGCAAMKLSPEAERTRRTKSSSPVMWQTWTLAVLAIAFAGGPGNAES